MTYRDDLYRLHFDVPSRAIASPPAVDVHSAGHHPAVSTDRRWAATARWVVTLAATVVSTCALDLVATAAGLLLTASNVLDGSSRATVIGFLAATYVVWAVGLRVNLIANWRLLEETGTSTNALSKVGFEVARLRSSSQRVVRAASAAGYVLTELAKDAPYYASAFGAALLSDSVDSTDALVFLGGANLGAAVYEYGVAGLTRGYLRRIPRRPTAPSTKGLATSGLADPSYASFDTDWVPGRVPGRLLPHGRT